MVLLTAFVWARMLQVRVAAMKQIRLHPEKMKSQQAKSLLPEAANIPAENFINIFEVPVLFYVLIGFMLIMEGGHSAGVVHGEIPKGYLYFAIFFSTTVELLNMKLRKNKPIQLHGATEKAVEEGLIDKKA